MSSSVNPLLQQLEAIVGAAGMLTGKLFDL